MLEIITKGLTKIFGSKSERDLKKIYPVIDLVEKEYQLLQNSSDDELRNKSIAFKATIKEELKSFSDKIDALNKEANDSVTIDVTEKEKLFAEIDKLQKDSDAHLEKVLERILPQAFAVVRETARRYKENKSLNVKATEFDIQLSKTKKNVEIQGDRAIWHNKWLVTGHELAWEMVHYRVQLIGGYVLHEGKISEMATGEGKTLVATLPAYLNALAGFGVHIVTVNDYLAKRDSEWMAPLFEFHMLTVDCIDKHESHSSERKQAYNADITYGTNNEFGFDYLRDNMSRSIEDQVQRKHHYAMVDEVDSVLIDDARTPLIISGPVGKNEEEEFAVLKPKVLRLVEAQKKIANDFLVQAKKMIGEDNKKEGGLALYRAYRALPKSKPLIKFLSETGVRQILQKTENIYIAENQRMMPEADAPLLFTIDEKQNSVELTDKGIEFITGSGEDPNMFVLPDIGLTLHKIEKDNSLSTEEKAAQKELALSEYTFKAQQLHLITQLLKAYALFEKDVDYIIVENKVKIVDEQTGRVMEGRRYSDGLHQALEAKESVKVEDATQTYATITLQNYFRMYHKLAGMTGTAETEAQELWDIYKLDVVVIPTNIPPSRKDMQDKVYKTTREKYNAVIDEVVELVNKGRPVLVGTTSVENSEIISRMLKLRNIKHQVLNAKQHQKEAEIVTEAGKPGTVTIATNMAGRGTDIKLTSESKSAGGLAIIGTERHESRRVDRQLRGRSGRQGDPGTSQFYVSLEDNLMRLFGSDRIAKMMDTMGLQEGEVIQHSLITSSIERAQKKVEENNFGTRKRLLEYDNVMNSQREVIYRRRRNALYGDRLSLDVQNMIYDTCMVVSESTINQNSFDAFQLAVLQNLGFATTLNDALYMKKATAELGEALFSEAITKYSEKQEQLKKMLMPRLKELQLMRPEVENIIIPFTDGHKSLSITVSVKKLQKENTQEIQTAIEKYTSLAFIDMGWKDHLRDMDDLKQSVHNAVFEQKDPLLIYKFESYELYKKFLDKINVQVVNFLFKGDVEIQEAEQVREAAPAPRKENYKTTKEEAKSSLAAHNRQESAPEEQEIKQTPIRVQKVANRNDRVTVQYMNGEIKKDVKFKTVEDDLKNNKCVIIEE